MHYLKLYLDIVRAHKISWSIYAFLFTLLGLYLYMTMPDAVGGYIALIIGFILALHLLGIVIIVGAITAIKRPEIIRSLFNLTHFLFAVKLFMVLYTWAWLNNSNNSHYEPEAAYYAFIVATMEYFRRRLKIAEAPHRLLDLFAIGDKLDQ